MEIPEVLGKAVEFMLSHGFEDIKHLPGCAEMAIDETWWIALNGHEDTTECSKGVGVPPFSLYIEFNGWPAGVVTAYGGTMAAGSIANEREFIAAIERAQSGTCNA